MSSLIFIKKYNYIDLICCNAGIARDDDGLASVEQWKDVWHTNVLQHDKYC